MSDAVAPQGTPKEYACNTPKGQIRLADLPLERLADIEKQTGLDWYVVIRRPRKLAQHAIPVYEHCCAEMGAEPETLTGRMLVDVFEIVDEDLPDMYQAGIPKAEGEASTATSPGAPSTSSGPPPKSDS